MGIGESLSEAKTFSAWKGAVPST